MNTGILRRSGKKFYMQSGSRTASFLKSSLFGTAKQNNYEKAFVIIFIQN